MIQKNIVQLAIESFKAKNKITRSGARTLAKEMGVTPMTVYRWIRSGEVSLERVEEFSKLTDTRPIDLNKKLQRFVPAGK